MGPKPKYLQPITEEIQGLRRIIQEIVTESKSCQESLKSLVDEKNSLLKVLESEVNLLKNKNLVKNVVGELYISSLNHNNNLPKVF